MQKEAAPRPRAANRSGELLSVGRRLGFDFPETNRKKPLSMVTDYLSLFHRFFND
jgi:hypothetical protein